MKNPSITRNFSGKCPFGILLATIILTFAFHLDAQVTKPGSPAPAADKLAAVDDRLINALQTGDAQALGTIVGDRIIGILRDPYYTKDALVKRAARGGTFPGPETLAGRSVRMFGATGDVAIVDGYLKAGSEAQNPNGNYYAVYAMEDGDWKLVLYTFSRQQGGGGGLGGSASDPVAARAIIGTGTPIAIVQGANVAANYGRTSLPMGATGSVASLTTDERMVVERMRLYMDSLARRMFNQFGVLMDKEMINGRIPLGATPKSNKESYIAAKFTEPAGAAPEIIGLLSPHVIICGANRDVAVLDAIRIDASGGAFLGTRYEPKWRGGSGHQLSVWIRTSPSTQDWRIVQLVNGGGGNASGPEVTAGGSQPQSATSALADALTAIPEDLGVMRERTMRANGHAAEIAKAAITAAPEEAVMILSTLINEVPLQRALVTAAAVSAAPNQAVALTGAACRAALSTTSNLPEDDRAIAGVTAAAVSSARSQAGPMVAAAVTAAPCQVGVVIAAGITAAPDQADQIVRAAIAASPTQAADMVQGAVSAAPSEAAALQQAANEVAPGQSAEIAKSAAAGPTTSILTALAIAAQYSPGAGGKGAQ